MKRNLVSKLHLLLLTSITLMLILSLSSVSLAFTKTEQLEQTELAENQQSIEELPLAIDFSLGSFNTTLQQIIYDFLVAHQSQLPNGIYDFTVTVQYEDKEGIQHIALIPTEVYKSHWSIPLSESQIVRLTIHQEENNKTTVEFWHLPSVTQNPFSGDYRFPWTGGDTWLKTQGFHYNNLGYSLDFVPNGNPPVTRSIEAGLLTAMCYIASDPYQAMVKVSHADGVESGYLHLIKSTVPDEKFNAQIPLGEYLGDLFNEDVTFNPHPDCGDPNQYLYATACGCGTAMHLHFETNSLISIQGYSLQSISSSPYGTPYTSTNGPDTIPPTVTITQQPATGQWFASDQTFSWSISDNANGFGVRGYKFAWDQNPPGGSEYGSSSGSTMLSTAGEGQHTLYIQAWDNADNPSDVVSVGWFGYDVTVPSNPNSVNSGCTAVHNVWQNSCTNPAFTWSGASDSNGSGVQDYHIYWGTAPSGIPDTWRSTADFDPPTITPSGNVATYYLRVATRDNVGHESTPTTLFILRYDNSTPTGDPLVNGGAETVYNMNVTVQPQGSDTGSGVAKVHLSNDGVQWQTITSETAVSWSLLGLNRAWNPLWMQLEDGAGNRSPIYQQQVCLDIYPAHPSSTSFRLWSAGPTIAGGTLSSSNFQLTQSVGQIGSSTVFSSNNFQLQSGFSLASSTSLDLTLFTPFSCGQSMYLPIAVRP